MDISVVITTRNRPAFLIEALSGLSLQTKKPKEVIVIDDCSEESYQEALSAIQRNNAKFVRLDKRSGANRARNIGITKSSGAVIAFLDDDDVWLPDYLCEISRQYIEGADAVVTGFRQLGNESVIVVNDDVRVTETSLLRGNTYCGMSGFSCRRDLLENLWFDEELPNGQDWDIFVRVFLSNAEFRNIPKALFSYRFQNADGIGAKLRYLSPENIYPRLASAIKHRSFLGDYWFRKRISEQVLFSLKHKHNKAKWVLLSVKLAGVKATVSFFYRALRRKVLKQPMSI